MSCGSQPDSVFTDEAQVNTEEEHLSPLAETERNSAPDTAATSPRLSQDASVSHRELGSSASSIQNLQNVSSSKLSSEPGVEDSPLGNSGDYPATVGGTPSSEAVPEQEVADVHSPVAEFACGSGGGDSVGECSDLLDSDLSGVDEEYGDEPFLKYERPGADLQQLLVSGDTATCLCVHAKFVIVGTASGRVHVFDHLGHRVQQPSQPHSLAVNQLSTTTAGDHVVSCSDDGLVHVAELAGGACAQRVALDTPARSVALDPQYGRATHRLAVGSTRVLLYERTSFLGRTRTTILPTSDTACGGGSGSVVQTMRWGGPLLAWACAGEVRVYHVEAARLVSVIVSDVGTRPQHYRCHLHWLDSGCQLLVGWRDKVQLARLRDKSGAMSASRVSAGADISRWYMEIVYIFHTDFVVGGVASGGFAWPSASAGAAGVGGSGSSQLVLLSVAEESASGGSKNRPQVRVIRPSSDDYEEFSADELTVRDYHCCAAAQYQLESLADEGVVFVLAPTDLIVVRPRDADDHIDWLLEQQQYEEALQQLQRAGAAVRRHSLQNVGRKYLDSLIHQQHYELAASLCHTILGRNRVLWEEEVYRYAALRQLPAISDHLPCTEFKLSSTVYEMVLYQFLRTDPAAFLSLVRRWSPALYHCGAVINAALEQLLRDVDNRQLLEALALLYGHQSRHDKALAVYLKLGHRLVFTLARRHQLHSLLAERAAALARIDSEEAVQLLTERPDVTSCPLVVHQLAEQPTLLFSYLCRLHERHPGRAAVYHDRMVELYAELEPEKLLGFLRASGGAYSLQRALEVCGSRGLVAETVYLLGRTGATRRALRLIMSELADIDGAIAFCTEHSDTELWDDLIALCCKQPLLVRRLMLTIGSHVDPQRLITQLSPKLRVPGLRSALVHMLQERRSLLALQRSCRSVLVRDCFQLHAQMARAGQAAVTQLKAGSSCVVCGGRQLQSMPEAVCVFHCGHSCHQRCFSAEITTTTVTLVCPVCKTKS